MRGATIRTIVPDDTLTISIHAPRERSDTIHAPTIYRPVISIHAPRERSDKNICLKLSESNNFNPRSSWEERQVLFPILLQVLQFQSTLLVRGATIRPDCGNSDGRFQSTLLVRGATSPVISPESIDLSISIHAPRERSDRPCKLQKPLRKISIHAPRERSDQTLKHINRM